MQAHRLRKVGAIIAADNGATDRQLMALFDWTSQKQANVRGAVTVYIGGTMAWVPRVNSRALKCPTFG